MLHSRRSAASAAKFSTSIVYNGNSSAKRILSVLKKDIENFSSSMPKILLQNIENIQKYSLFTYFLNI